MLQHRNKKILILEDTLKINIKNTLIVISFSSNNTFSNFYIVTDVFNNLKSSEQLRKSWTIKLKSIFIVRLSRSNYFISLR